MTRTREIKARVSVRLEQFWMKNPCDRETHLGIVTGSTEEELRRQAQELQEKRSEPGLLQIEVVPAAVVVLVRDLDDRPLAAFAGDEVEAHDKAEGYIVDRGIAAAYEVLNLPLDPGEGNVLC